MLRPQAKAMPKARSNTSRGSHTADRCHRCPSSTFAFTCARCSLSACITCRFRRWTVCKACFWTREASNLLSAGIPARGLEKRMTAKIEFEERFWQAFLLVEGKPNEMTLAAQIAGGKRVLEAETCHLCEEKQVQRPAIAQCSRCRLPLCEHCIDDYPGCRCLACHVLSLSTEAENRIRHLSDVPTLH